MQFSIDPAQIVPIVAIAAGLLVLLVPRALNYVVAIWLIVYGLIELRVIDRFWTT